MDPLFQETRTIGIGLTAKDTPMYYDPMEAFSQEGSYLSICRMPGLMPVYLPFRSILEEQQAVQCVVVFQVIADIITSWLVCLMAVRFFPSLRVLTISTVLTCAGSFVSVRSIYLLSDSLGISALILSAFFLTRFADTEKKSSLFWSGLLLVWAIFLRQILILILPVYGIILLTLTHLNWRKFIRYSLWLFAPALIILASWTIRNRLVYDRTIILVAPVEECMTQLTPAYSSIRKFIIITGKDFQPWTIGDAAHWFVQPDSLGRLRIPYAPSTYTSEFNADSLIQLKRDYITLLALTEGTSAYAQLEGTIIEKSKRFGESYISEHPMKFYVGDKLGFLFKFLFPKKIDDLPLPSLSEMNPIQKFMKGSSLLLLWIISALSLFGFAYALFSWKNHLLIWALIPFSLIAVQSYLGFIEQRFLAVSYPFMAVMAAAVLNGFYTRVKKSLSAQLH
ncbi:MAG: hypothetical protein ACK478_03680 [Flavobacteriales bacterium]